MRVVLVVDDDPDLRFLARVLLQREGYEVQEAEDGAQALGVLEGEHRIDVVLLDLRMPHMSGWELLRRLREQGNLDGLHVIVFSANIEPRGHERALREGARAYLSKPFRPEDLRTALESPAG